MNSKCVAVLIMILSLAYGAKGTNTFDPIVSYRVLLNFVAGEKMSLQMIIPDKVLMNDDVHGQCISDIRFPLITITRESRRNGCNFRIEMDRKTVEEGENKFY